MSADGRAVDVVSMAEYGRVLHRLDRLKEDVRRLRDALIKHGRHSESPQCSAYKRAFDHRWRHNPKSKRCDCGLSATLRSLAPGAGKES